MYKIYTKKIGMSNRHIAKIWLIMRLTTVILIATLMQVSATTLAQRITLNRQKISLEKIFREIHNQTGYDFLYDKDLLDGKKAISIVVNNEVLEKVLDKCLKNQSLVYAVEDKMIVISEGKKNAANQNVQLSDQIIVRGKVVDEQGNPMTGATVRVDGKKIAITTITNDKGEFSISNVEEGSKIFISFLGFNSKTLVAGADMGTVVLEMSNAKLDDVQVQAYGTTTKRFTTGSLAKISSVEIEQQPISNPILALQGRAAGVFISESGGVSGSNFNIIIQGQNTITAGRLPLYVIDGVPFGGKPIELTAGTVSTPPAILGGAGLSPLNSISPNDIESITVLKDADATAIYGSRAANGVVLITTKKGKPGQTKVDIDLYSGFSEVTRTIPMLNAVQYLTIRKQAFLNDNITPSTTNALDLTTFNTGDNTDFQKFLIGNRGHFSNATINLSGGSEQLQFFIGANYRRETPVLIGNFADNKAQVRMNLQYQTQNKKFSMNAAVSYTDDNNLLPPVNLGQSYFLAPNLPVYKPNGDLAFYSGYNNPAANLKSIYSQKSTNLLSNVSLNYNILPGLNFKTDLGFNRISTNVTNASLRASKDPVQATSATGSIQLIQSFNQLFLIEPQIGYSRKIGKGDLSAFIGGTYQYTQFIQPSFISGTFTNDALYNDLSSITITNKASSFGENKYASVFGRLNYNWDGKYIVNGNYRRDGSSRFSPGNRFGNFGSVGLGWIVSEEDFLKDKLNWLSFAKLRSSYGSIGNDQIQDYGYISFYAGTGNNYAGIPSTFMAQLANEDNYTWETTRKLDAAIDLGFFKDRILLTASWYRNRTSNLLLNRTLPIASQSGFTAYTGNLPGLLLQNKGWEFELTTTNVKSKSFTWTSSFNFTAPKNKLLAYPNLLTSTFAAGYPGTGYVIGESLNLLSGYRFTGVVNGVATVADLNGDGRISTGLNANGRGDFDVLGNKDPKFYGGLSNSFSCQNFQLDFLFQYVKQKGYNYYNYFPGFPGGNTNFPEDILNYNFRYNSLNSASSSLAYVNYFKLSDETVSDASYIRLKNISIAYNVPSLATKKIGMKSGSVYLRAQNLFTITNYKGFDPETQGTAIPPLRLITLGLRATF